MKISFCTTCMGRLHHLKLTLPKNLETAESYPDHEFILLNYGSKDAMHEWCVENLRDQISSGRLKYFRTEKPTFFMHSHAKNLACRQATGQIIINLDADNYLVPGYVEFAADSLAGGRCIVASHPEDAFGVAGSFGKIAVLKEHFYSVNGYDEDIDYGWGWEDNHFINRVVWQNHIEIVMADKALCRVIEHGNDERVENCMGKDMSRNQAATWRKLMDARSRGRYVANEGVPWGFASDLRQEEV